jgi:hypothetical protein
MFLNPQKPQTGKQIRKVVPFNFKGDLYTLTIVHYQTVGQPTGQSWCILFSQINQNTPQ